MLPQVWLFYRRCSLIDYEIQWRTSGCSASTVQKFLAISHTYTEVDRWGYICQRCYFMYIKLSVLQNCSRDWLPFKARKEKERGKQQKGQAFFLFIIPTSYVKDSLAKFAPKLWFFGTTLSSHISNTLFFQVQLFSFFTFEFSCHFSSSL